MKPEGSKPRSREEVTEGAVTPARRAALEVVRRSFEDGSYTDRAFRAVAERDGLQGRVRSQAQWLAYGAVQRRGSLDFLIGRLARRPVKDLDAAVVAVLRLALFELLYAASSSAYAVLNEAVEMTRLVGAPRAAGFVNAVLRRAVRERSRIERDLNRRGSPEEIAIADSLPRWLAKMWWEQFGKEGLIGLASASNRPAERALRINSERWSIEEALNAARQAGVEMTVAAIGEGESDPLRAPEMVIPSGSWAPIEPWIEDGLATPQSRGSAAVVAILDPRPGEHILDMCAGPGTKTGQIAARMEGQGELVAVEQHQGRAGETADQLRRLGVHIATVVEADAATVDLRGPGFDRVLVDAPCSDLGTLNSRPDARWRKSPEMIDRLVELQRRILLNAARHLRPGGVLVYSTCTLSAAENEEQVAALVRSGAEDGDSLGLVADDLGAEFPDLASDRDSRFLQIRPDRDGTTGFFIARLRRR